MLTADVDARLGLITCERDGVGQIAKQQSSWPVMVSLLCLRGLARSRRWPQRHAASAPCLSHWITACDANMEPMQFRSGEWSREAKAQVKALHGGVSTYRAEGAGDNEIGKVLDHFILNESVDNRIGNFESGRGRWLQAAQTSEVRNQAGQGGQGE